TPLNIFPLASLKLTTSCPFEVLSLAFRAVERVAFATLPVVVRVQMPSATRDQLLVTHSGESRDLLAIGASQWFARVAAARWRLADQPDLVRLDLLLFHDIANSR
ncbi:MAG TPA: hypothetical protein VIP49_05385, partial [Candidatus Udaeobacter sp.]